MGLTATTFIVAIQSSVNWKVRGVATASNMFMRILGTTIGVTLLGGVLNSRLNAYLQHKQAEVAMKLSINLTHQLADAQNRAKLPPQAVKIMQDGLTNALHSVYWGVLIFAVISMALIFFMPKIE